MDNTPEDYGNQRVGHSWLHIISWWFCYLWWMYINVRFKTLKPLERPSLSGWAELMSPMNGHQWEQVILCISQSVSTHWFPRNQWALEQNELVPWKWLEFMPSTISYTAGNSGIRLHYMTSSTLLIMTNQLLLFNYVQSGLSNSSIITSPNLKLLLLFWVIRKLFVYIMKANCQELFRHRVPQMTECTSERFRKVLKKSEPVTWVWDPT